MLPLQDSFVLRDAGVFDEGHLGTLTGGRARLNFASLDDWDGEIATQSLCVFMQGALKFIDSLAKFRTFG